MADNTEDMSFATAGSGKSPAEVAFELVSKLKGQGVWGEKNMPEILDMYAECLDAANGLRAYPGQNRVEAPVSTPEATPAASEAKASIPSEPPAPVQQAPAMHDIAQAVHTQPAAEPQSPAAPPMPNHTFNNIG